MTSRWFIYDITIAIIATTYFLITSTLSFGLLAIFFLASALYEQWYARHA